MIIANNWRLSMINDNNDSFAWQSALKRKYPYLLEEIRYIEHAFGWMEILIRLFERIEEYESQRGWEAGTIMEVDSEKSEALADMYENVRFVQIKEKFGRLRAYYTGGDAHIRELVNKAESESTQTCEICGKTKGAKLRQTGNCWLYTSCNKHKRA